MRAIDAGRLRMRCRTFDNESSSCAAAHVSGVPCEQTGTSCQLRLCNNGSPVPFAERRLRDRPVACLSHLSRSTATLGESAANSAFVTRVGPTVYHVSCTHDWQTVSVWLQMRCHDGTPAGGGDAVQVNVHGETFHSALQCNSPSDGVYHCILPCFFFRVAGKPALSVHARLLARLRRDELPPSLWASGRGEQAGSYRAWDQLQLANVSSVSPCCMNEECLLPVDEPTLRNMVSADPSSNAILFAAL